MVLDLFVHFRLGKERLVLLIVTISSIANDVNENVLLELLLIGDGNLHTAIQKIWLISVDMDYRGPDGLGYLCTIVR
jgi:hypothetical protein